LKKYKVYYQEENSIKTTIISDIESFDLPNNIIKIKEYKAFSLKYDNIFETVSKKEIYNFFVELNMILNANILLSDAIKILMKTTKNRVLRKILISMENALINGKEIYKSLEEYEKYLDPIIIPFFNILEKKGNISLVLSSLSSLLKIKMENKRKLLSALRYPFIVLGTFFFSLILIFNFVVPKFETIFLQYEMKLPLSTTILLECKWFLSNYSFFIIITLFIIFLFSKYIFIKFDWYLYYKDMILAKYIPILSKMIQTYELYNFFVALNILLKSKYEFHIAIDNSTLLIKNKYLLAKILKINEHLKNGKSIAFAFEQTELFDDLTISLINSGEKSNSIQISVDKIEKIYKDNFQKSIKVLSSFIEPLFFILISLLILWIMLAVFTPIWNMSGMLNS